MNADRPNDEMLVEFVRDRLSSADAARVSEAADRDPALAAEITALRAIRNIAREPEEAAWSSELGWARLSREIRQEQAPKHSAMGWKVACIVLGVVAAGQLALSAFSGQQDPAGPQYELVGAEAQQPLLRVIFRADAKESEIRDLVRSSGGEMVGGPSAQALYDIGFADAAARDAALALFSQRSDLVEHAEAAGPR